MSIKNTEKRVDVFNLTDPESKARYEELLNDPKMLYVIKEEFTYSKSGNQPITTIWYEYQKEYF